MRPGCDGSRAAAQRRQGRRPSLGALATSFFLLQISLPGFFVSACRGGAAISRSIDDATVTTRVKTALLNTTDVDATKIDVDTAAGVVTLRGTVGSKEGEAKAIEVTRRVAGVRDVRSELQIQ